MNADHTDIRKDKKKKKQALALAAVAATTAVASTHPRFQPDSNFTEASIECTMSLDQPGTQLCLLQLPLTWEAEAHGVIELPAVGASTPGTCASYAGNEYHVLEEQASMPSQLFAFAPGSGGPPRQIERSLTLVKAANLDMNQLKARQKEEDAAAPHRSHNQENGAQAQTRELKPDKVKKDKKRKSEVSKEIRSSTKKKRNKTSMEDIA